MRISDMFICSRCKAEFDLPKCSSCGYEVEKHDGIWQLTDDPDIMIDGDSDKYVGYEHIGESYSGNRKYLIEERDSKFAKEIARLTGDGIFLDLGCGDGCLAVPAASLGVKVIAADISNSMLRILIAKAESNNVSLHNAVICRMNALGLPIADNSIELVVANSVLHLISNPEKVIDEIHRVLKPNGYFVCEDDTPGKAASTEFDNTKYNEITGSMYSQYWARMKEYDVLPKKYSWRFDRDAVCRSIFCKNETKVIEHNRRYSTMMKDGFLPRFFARDFSDQVAVPKTIHDDVISQLYDDFKQRYGDGFDSIPFTGDETDIALTIYTK